MKQDTSYEFNFLGYYSTEYTFVMEAVYVVDIKAFNYKE